MSSWIIEKRKLVYEWKRNGDIFSFSMVCMMTFLAYGLYLYPHYSQDVYAKIVYETPAGTSVEWALESGRYIIVRIAAIIADTFILFLLVDMEGVNAYVAKIVDCLIITLFTYSFNRKFVFQER